MVILTPARIKLSSWANFDRLSWSFYRLSEISQSALSGRYIAPMNEAKQTGVTIYELPITIILIGIFLSVGVPSMSSFMHNSRITGAANDVHPSF